jgi:hypothetical protein
VSAVTKRRFPAKPVIGRTAGSFGGTIIQHTERRTIFSADRRGIAVRGDPQRSLFDGGRKPAEQAERNAAFVVEFELPTEKDSDRKPER